ncbi:MAG: helix-turn-helix transcriptional regulator [Bryobacteraceae bacterium]
MKFQITSTERFLTEKELSELLNISVPTLRRWRAIGEGPEFVKCGPALVRYEWTTVQRWIAEGRNG